MATTNCGGCEHWLVNAQVGGGLCRRYPPTILAIPGADALGRSQVVIQAFFPPVTKEMTCGEWVKAKAVVL